MSITLDPAKLSQESLNTLVQLASQFAASDKRITSYPVWLQQRKSTMYYVTEEVHRSYPLIIERAYNDTPAIFTLDEARAITEEDLEGTSLEGYAENIRSLAKNFDPWEIENDYKVDLIYAVDLWETECVHLVDPGPSKDPNVRRYVASCWRSDSVSKLHALFDEVNRICPDLSEPKIDSTDRPGLAVRIIHIPSGVEVRSQSERTFQQNFENAIRLIVAKLDQSTTPDEVSDPLAEFEKLKADLQVDRYRVF